MTASWCTRIVLGLSSLGEKIIYDEQPFGNANNGQSVQEDDQRPIV